MPLKPVDTAITVLVGPLIDDTNFKSRETAVAYDAGGMDVDLIVEKTDGTTAKTDITLTSGGANDWTHKGNGYYEVEITAAQNTEEGVLRVVGFCTGVLPFGSVAYDAVPTMVYDSLVKGTDKLEVDHVQLGGSTQSATDLKDFAEAGYDPATNKVQGVVLVDTITTYTGNTKQTADHSDLLTAIAGYLDTEVAAIKAVTDNLPDSGALTTIGTDTARLTAARAQVLDDWINFGRLDALLDAIKAVTDNLPDSGALTTIGADTARLTAVRAAVLTDWINDGRLDLLLDAIPTTKTGYKLASDGLDTVATTAPTGVAGNFREMVVQTWRKFFKKADQTSTQAKTYADNGTDVLTTQALSDDATTQTQGPAT